MNDFLPTQSPKPPEVIVKLKTADGTWHSQKVDIPVTGLGSIIQTLMFEVDGLPIFVTHFFFHDDSKTLHTICRRIPDPEIDTMEW